MTNWASWFRAQLQSSADGFVWAFEQIAPELRDKLPPRPGYLGAWPPIRHMWHVALYERWLVIPHQRANGLAGRRPTAPAVLRAMKPTPPSRAHTRMDYRDRSDVSRPPPEQHPDAGCAGAGGFASAASNAVGRQAAEDGRHQDLSTHIRALRHAAAHALRWEEFQQEKERTEVGSNKRGQHDGFYLCLSFFARPAKTRTKR